MCVRLAHGQGRRRSTCYDFFFDPHEIMNDAAATVLGTADELRRGLRRAGQLKGRQPQEGAIAEVRALIGPVPPGGHRRDLLIEYLHRLNDAWHGLHERHLVALAREMNIPMAEVMEVASFYHHFELLPGDEPGVALTVRVCESLSCEMAGARDLLARLPSLVGREVRVIAAPCIGRCEQAPAALVGQVAVAQATPELVAQAVANELQRPAAQCGAASAPAGFIGYREYREAGGYSTAAAIVNCEDDAEDVLRAMEHSGLRGLGGAGFPAGRKWRIVREQEAPRFMAVNIDEGEPGTFKDRCCLERDPHRFLEGMLIAAQVVGTEAVYIYLRDEYHACRVMLEAELAALQADPPCPLPYIELRRGAGAYICGEESAMIESIEGKRGEPRLRPPYVAQVGLFGRPTLEHNFETLFWVRDILEKGPGVVRGGGTQRPQRPALLQRQRPRRAAGGQAGAGRHHPAATGRRILRRHGARARAVRVPAGRRFRRHPAGAAGRRAAGLRHLAAAWLLHRIGRHHRPWPARPGARRGAEHDAVLRPRELRPVHALPGGHGQGGAADGGARLGQRHAGRPQPGDGRRVDLRPRPGRAQPGALRAGLFPP